LSNAGYNLSVSSANNQLLKISGVNSSAAEIGYDFYSNNTLKNLSASAGTPVNLSSGTGVTPMAGTRIPIKVAIKSVDNKIAGTYQDTVTFTIATTE
jgi:spore coat protein U-like protein